LQNLTWSQKKDGIYCRQLVTIDDEGLFLLLLNAMILSEIQNSSASTYFNARLCGVPTDYMKQPVF